MPTAEEEALAVRQVNEKLVAQCERAAPAAFRGTGEEPVAHGMANMKLGDDDEGRFEEVEEVEAIGPSEEVDD